MNNVICGEAGEVLGAMAEGFANLVVTSPPYDNMRDYEGYNFSAQGMLKAIYKALSPGGVCAWVVGDKVVKGSRSLSSFKHAFIAKEVGFRVHDVMIYKKRQTPFSRSNAYTSCFEYIFIFSKGAPTVFNPLTTAAQPRKRKTQFGKGPDGVNRYRVVETKSTKTCTNVFEYSVGTASSRDKIAFEHPAIFPEKLAEDQITSWSNYGDVVLDPMCGSGTTLKAAKLLGRKYFGIDISPHYCAIARARVATANG